MVSGGEPREIIEPDSLRPIDHNESTSANFLVQSFPVALPFYIENRYNAFRISFLTIFIFMPSKIIVLLTPNEVKVLEKIDKSRTVDAAVQARARIILDSANGLRNKDIATNRNYERHYITYWKRRWNQLYQQREQSDPNERPKMSQKLIVKWLSDLERSGRKPIITAEQRNLILAIACEPPEKSGYPHTQWSDRLLAK
jgi:hypothetical protein